MIKFVFLILGCTAFQLELLEMFHKSLVQKPQENDFQIKLADQIQRLSLQKSQKKKQCDQIQSSLQQIQIEKDKNQKFINWLTSRIDTNMNRIQNLRSLKCDSSSHFIDVMNVQSKIQRIIKYLKQYQGDEKSLFLQETINFIQEIQENNENHNLLTVLEEQIQQCKVKPLIRSPPTPKIQNFKQELQKLVVDLDEDTTKFVSSFELNQIKTQDSTDKFIVQLDKERIDLQIHLDKIIKIINNNPIEVSQRKRYEQCQADLEVIDRQILCSQEAIKKIQIQKKPLN
ncbi:hypothetical protein pb186bvf_012456 [Paramecium bursaria]